MNGPTGDEVISLVKSSFDIVDLQQDQYVIRFRIRVSGFRSKKFAELAQGLEKRGIVCSIHRGDSPEELRLVVRRLEARKQRWLSSSPQVPRILFAVVIGFIMLDGYYRTLGTNQVVQIGDPLQMAVVYTAALLGILGVHELGHLVASRIHRINTSWPYFIPGIPIIGIPTFGALIMAKGLMINREKTFDVAIAGPIAGLAVVVVVSLYAAATAPVIDAALSEQLHGSDQLVDWRFGEPLLMKGSLALFGKSDGTDGEVLMTPLLFATWIGFFLTFANLMPAGQLDGGHMMRAAFGRKMLRAFTYVSAGILILMNFWFVALFVLFMSGKNTGVTLMDDITPLPGRRKTAYGIVMVLAVLCAPIPDSLIVAEPLLHLIQ